MRIIIDPERPKPRAVDQVSKILQQGGVIVYPTDTVYGLGCMISNKKGIDRIQAIKKSQKPMSIMLPDISTIGEYAKVSNESFRLIKSLVPGPYTFILPATRLVPKLLQSNRKSIGIRIPDHWFCMDILRQVGEPIITTSIPMSSDHRHIDPLMIEDEFRHTVDAIIDSGLLPDIPSTVISMEDDNFEIVRIGLGPVDFLA